MALATGDRNSYRPAVMGTHYMAASTHYLATAAATRIFEQGGNAIDAGVAAGLCVGTLERDLTDPGGVAPIIIYSAREQRVVTIAGLGRWPAAASIDYFKRHHGGLLPRGILRSVTPAAPYAWLTALERYGRLTFGQVAQPAIELAEEGFPIFPRLAASIAEAAPILSEWPSSAEIFLPAGRPPAAGETLVQRDLARTFRRLAEAERAAAGDREAGLRAARDLFYKGEIASQIARFCQAQGGLLTERDLAGFEAKLEAPVTTNYAGVQVYACGPWTQGPVIPIALNLLRGFDLLRLGHNTAEYLHTVAECFNLAFADRERFVGDPEFVDVPLEGLLSKVYADERRRLVRSERAFGEMPPAGDPWKYQQGGAREPEMLAGAAGGGGLRVSPQALDELIPPDTSYVCAVDSEGNVFSATPSDPCVAESGSPIVPGLGLIVSARGSLRVLRRSIISPSSSLL